MELKESIHKIACEAKEAAQLLTAIPTEKINKALLLMADKLDSNRGIIQDENAKDLEAGKKKGLTPAMLNRLTLSDKTIDTMVDGLKTIAELPSPIGEVFDKREHPLGMSIKKVRVPIGVIGIIYESRPNVTVDAAAICLKSNNAVILRGGSEAIFSNTILAKLFSDAMAECGLPALAVTFIDTTDREAVQHLLKESENIDLIIPRGGERLIETVVENSRIPVIKHYKGVCHIYISPSADIDKAEAIICNAKVQRPGVCNAMETLVIDKRVSKENQKRLLNALIEKGVTLFGDQYIQELNASVEAADETTWGSEYLDLRCSVKSVDSIEEAIKHINRWNSGHTEAIITESDEEKKLFTTMVDSSSVMVNASTRFADGGEYGMGCEIGISTDKLHARGPMGVNDLTTYKWIVEGDGTVRP